MTDLSYKDEMFLFYLFDSEVNPDASPEAVSYTHSDAADD